MASLLVFDVVVLGRPGFREDLGAGRTALGVVVLERPHAPVTLVYPGRGLLFLLEQRYFDREFGRLVEWWLAHRQPVAGA